MRGRTQSSRTLWWNRLSEPAFVTAKMLADVRCGMASSESDARTCGVASKLQLDNMTLVTIGGACTANKMLPCDAAAAHRAAPSSHTGWCLFAPNSAREAGTWGRTMNSSAPKSCSLLMFSTFHSLATTRRRLCGAAAASLCFGVGATLHQARHACRAWPSRGSAGPALAAAASAVHRRRAASRTRRRCLRCSSGWQSAGMLCTRRNAVHARRHGVAADTADDRPAVHLCLQTPQPWPMVCCPGTLRQHRPPSAAGAMPATRRYMQAPRIGCVNHTQVGRYLLLSRLQYLMPTGSFGYYVTVPAPTQQCPGRRTKD